MNLTTLANDGFNQVPLYQADVQDIVTTYVGPSLLTLSSMSCFIILNTYLKKLNEVMKKFLKVLSIHNFLCSLIAIIQTTYILVSHNQSFEACGILSHAWIPTLASTMDSLTMLSFMRYHIAWKTKNTESVDKSFMIKIGTGIFITEHFITFLWNMGSYTFKIPYWTANCAFEDDINDDGPIIVHVLMIFKIIGIMIFGVVQDILLVRFLKKENKSSSGPGQAKLVKWKSSKEQDYQFTIPISAGVFSFASSAFLVTMMVWIMEMIGKNEGKSHMKIKTVFETWTSIQMPIMLSMTIKAAKKKKPLPKIPQKPMFHDENDEEAGNDENKDEDQDDETPNQDHEFIQPQPSTSKVIYVKPADPNNTIENHM